MRNFKNLKYSWETDPRIAAWKKVSDAMPLEAPPTRVKIDGEWVYAAMKEPQSPIEDARSKEQIENDVFIDQVKVWDKQPEKKMLNEVRLVKKDIRDLGRRIYKFKNEQAVRPIKKIFVYDYGDPELCAHFLKQAENSWGSRFSKGVFWHDLIDYVNQRFGLEIPKDILTDKEREKAILIRDKYSNLSSEK